MLRRVSILEAPRPATKIDPGLFRDAGRAITSPGLTLRATTNMPITPERDFCSYPGWRATLRSLGFGQRSVREGGNRAEQHVPLSWTTEPFVSFNIQSPCRARAGRPLPPLLPDFFPWRKPQ